MYPRCWMALLLSWLLLAFDANHCAAFLSKGCGSRCTVQGLNARHGDTQDLYQLETEQSRRAWLRNCVFSLSTGTSVTTLFPYNAWADFTPGGTLVDREVGVTVGNPQASASRKPDNTNVLFAQDYYFKFGTAAPWIEPDSTEFPKTMPFVRVQQRYDALKKYGPRIQGGLEKIASLSKMVPADIPDPASSDVYQLRPMGLLANNMLASENTGATNELFLARWYINEIYLLVNDLRSASSNTAAVYQALRGATNSYLTLMNRVITEKVGDKFSYL